MTIEKAQNTALRHIKRRFELIDQVYQIACVGEMCVGNPMGQGPKDIDGGSLTAFGQLAAALKQAKYPTIDVQKLNMRTDAPQALPKLETLLSMLPKAQRRIWTDSE